MRHSSSGTSSRRASRSRDSTSTTRSRGCAIRSSATSASRTSRTTSCPACCGAHSSRERRAVLLIDEIDKADIEFPNDLLRELDRMEFFVYETRQAGEGAASARSSSSPATTRRSCRTHSCAAASSTTSGFPTARRWSRSSKCTTPGSRNRCWPKRSDRLLPDPRRARPQEEAVDVGTARLAQAAARRGHPAGSAALPTTRRPRYRRSTARC